MRAGVDRLRALRRSIDGRQDRDRQKTVQRLNRLHGDDILNLRFSHECFSCLPAHPRIDSRRSIPKKPKIPTVASAVVVVDCQPITFP